ncbi:MAG TPA: cobalamin-dependent protein [Herpetosiphonaceae bacterium]|nr:cobalamin-dependent protein [Herpetosiphonaceae bacterium]
MSTVGMMVDPRLKVLLVQLPVPNNPGANIPLAAGYLKAYAYQQGLLEHVRIEIMPREVVDAGGDALIVDEIRARQPDVLGISLYTWNSERTLHLAARTRAMLPDLLVIAGGPEVQRDNDWVLQHPAVDVAVLGEGEQTFAALLRTLLAERAGGRGPERSAPCRLCGVEGIAHRHGGEVLFTAARPGLDDLAGVPSPYLLGYLPLQPGDMALVECSRWCPYRCSFCLYGRNLGSKLGKRLFPLERVVAEVAWARDHGAAAVHFVEANLNLLPYFRPLTAALQAINADGGLKLYAELRGEHLSDEGVDALVAAGLHAAEVGLQSANPEALAAVDRRTDLLKWAAGARRLYARGVEVFLDVILGLPADDEVSVLRTLDWIEEQRLGPYDIFTLQVLPGTGVREHAARWALRYQDRPPYYVLGSDRLGYAQLRALRWELKERAGFDPREIEGMPELAGLHATHGRWSSEDAALFRPEIPRLVDYLHVDCRHGVDWDAAGAALAGCVASRVTVYVRAFVAQVLRRFCRPIALANPTIVWDVLIEGEPPPAHELREMRDEWPHETGYLDRIAVYTRPAPEPEWARATPRFVLLPRWGMDADPLRYEGLALLLWRFNGQPTQADLAAVPVRGGDGIVVEDARATGTDESLRQWQTAHGLLLWRLPQQLREQPEAYATTG